MSRPGTVPRSRPSRRATVAAPLRVTAERLDAHDVPSRPAGPAPSAELPVPRVPGPPSPPVTPVDADPADLTAAALVIRGETAPAATRHGEHSPRRRPWARLVELLTGRRRLAGRHRPAEVAVRGWSMFAPPTRRAGRRAR